MAMILDVHDDNGEYLKVLFPRREDVPSLVQDAASTDLMIDKTAADYSVVIDSGRGMMGKYPTCDPGNTYVSALYFNRYGGSLPEDLRKEASLKINAAVEDFGLSVDVDEHIKVANLRSDVAGERGDLIDAFACPEFGIIETVDNLTVSKSPSDRRQMWMTLKESPGFEKVASSQFASYSNHCVGNLLELNLLGRQDFLDEDQWSDLKKLANVYSSPDDLIEKIASFDVETGLNYLYDSRIKDAHMTVLEQNVRVKEASLDYDNLDYDKLTNVFGEEFVTTFKSDPEVVFSSLPDGDKRAISGMVQ